MNLFDSNVDLKILALFLKRSDSRFYVKQLAKELKISPSSASIGLKRLCGQGFLSRSHEGKEIYYSLMKNKPLNAHFGMAHLLYMLEQFSLVGGLLEIDSQLVSVAIYGSVARGNYDENSDVDILILGKKSKEEFMPILRKLGEVLGKEVVPTIMSPAEWMKLAGRKDKFYQELIKAHILLYGSRLAVE